MFSPYEQPSQPMPPAKPKNWLVESILITICCCLPFGIVAIIQAANVDSRYRMGDFEGAEQAAAEARKWVMYGLIAGLVANGLLFLFYMGMFLFSAATHY